MNGKIVLVALVLASLAGGVLMAMGGDLMPEYSTLAAVLEPEQKPEKPLIVEKPDEVIEVTITGARENGAQLYIEYTAKVGDAEVRGSVDAPLEADAETALQLIQSDILKTEQRDITKDEPVNVNPEILIGLKESATRSEIYEKFYPILPLTEEMEIITP